MITLIKNTKVYSPAYLGECDVLISGGRIAAIDNNIQVPHEQYVNVVDGKGQYLVPGFVDTLVHITGGGGEGGFNTRTPELDLFDAIKAGVTTMIGALGTDASTRLLGDLYGKAKALSADGLSCYMYTGSYEVPVKTLMDSVRDDMIFIDPVIGVGEVAIADSRGSQPSVAELARIAADARVGGMLSGKTGVVMIHVGDGEEKLSLLHQVCDQYEVSATQFYPTHINRNRDLLSAGVAFAKLGGYLDLTASTNEYLMAAGDVRASEALDYLLGQGVPSNQITFSSDAQGSLPNFDAKGELHGLDVGLISSLHEELVRSVKQYDIGLATALACITENPARITGLLKKGKIKVGCDADLCLLNANTLEIESVMTAGNWLLKDGVVKAKTKFLERAES